MHFGEQYIVSIIFVAIYAIAWIFVFRKHLKTCSGALGSGGFIILTYFLYGVAAFFLYLNRPEDFGIMHLIQFVYLFCLLYIGLMPVLSYDRSKIAEITPPPEIVLKVFTIVYCLCTLLYIPSAISNINVGITRLLTDTSGGADLYNERLQMGRQVDYGISNIFSIFYNIFSDVVVLVYFYYLTIPKGKKFLLTILTFAVLSSIFTSFAEGNRTQVTFVMLSLPASYLLFRNLYSDKVRRLFRIGGISLGAIVSFLFIILTISRFGKLDDGGSDSMLYYVGQAPLYFNEYAFDLGGVRYGDRTINLFKNMAGFDVPTGIFDTRAKYGYMATDDSIFTTYIGDFVLDFGPWITPLLVIVFTVVILRITRSQNGIIDFTTLIPIHYVMNVCVRGGMYLFCYPFMSNLMIFAYLFFYISCKIFANSKSAS